MKIKNFYIYFIDKSQIILNYNKNDDNLYQSLYKSIYLNTFEIVSKNRRILIRISNFRNNSEITKNTNNLIY